jgi:hypothetical protein
LPQWFHRLRQNNHNKKGKFDWSSFDERELDEDLSDPSEEWSDGEESLSSERSYSGVDTDVYYQLKELREDRK